MNNILVLLLLVIITLIIIYFKKTYYDKFTDVEASIVYLKAPTSNLTQTLEEKKTYSCDDATCQPKTVEKFENPIITEDMIIDTLDDINKKVISIDTNMDTIYNSLLNHNNVNKKTTDLSGKAYTSSDDYVNYFKKQSTEYLDKINSNIAFLEGYIFTSEPTPGLTSEPFDDLSKINKKKEISNYIVFS